MLSGKFRDGFFWFMDFLAPQGRHRPSHRTLLHTCVKKRQKRKTYSHINPQAFWDNMVLSKNNP
jgi:hemolysin-activating ACP:hemolysin acyltransferase